MKLHLTFGMIRRHLAELCKSKTASCVFFTKYVHGYSISSQTIESKRRFTLIKEDFKISILANNHEIKKD